jgi:general secretion pathway protein D
MKVIPTILLLSILATGLTRGAEVPEQSGEAPAPAKQESTEPSAQSATPDTNAPAAAPENAQIPSPTTPAEPNGTNGLRLNFRGASLDAVLNYLSEAAGFIIVLEAQPKGKVDVWSSQPLSRDEAVDLLNSVLNRNGYAAIRRGRTLTIINKDEAKTKAIPVHSGSDPESIPDTDEIVTQIIPVRFVEAAQLLKDLQPLVSTSTAMTANESGNSIVITDTQANIRRVAEVIKYIDSGAEDVTVVRVFKLKNSNASEMADLLTSLFPDDSRSGSQSPMRFGGPGGRFARFFQRGGFGGGGNQAGGGGEAQSDRIKKRNRVVAVADQRTSSVVVTATQDLMAQIEEVVHELDQSDLNVKKVAVIPLEHAEPEDAMQVLQDIFQKSGVQSSRNQQNQNTALRTRSNQQNQQYNNTTRSGMGQGGARRTGF